MPPLLLVLALLAPLPMARAGDELPPNLLVVVMDDVGVDQLAAYGLGSAPANTPTLDALWSKGVLFDGVWSAPICSPTRAHLMTGRFGFRTGVGGLVQNGSAPLPLEEATLPELLDAGTGGLYQHACFGKWHLGMTPEVDGLLAPNSAGFGHFAGTKGNLFAEHPPGSLPVDYYTLIEITNGVEQYLEGQYATTRTADLALEWMQTTPEPWYAHVNFHAPHDPWHAPPPELHTVDLSTAGPPELDPNPYYRAALEALDTELGRVLASMGELLDRTVVVIVADNGSPGPVVLPPFKQTKAKTTLYQGGIRVPLIISGPGVATNFSVCHAPVQTTDLVATLLELAGVDLAGTPEVPADFDSISLVPYLQDPSQPPLREVLYAERFTPNGLGPYVNVKQTARSERYKVIRDTSAPKQFYDLWVDPLEEVNLLGGTLTVLEQRALRQLDLAIDALKPLP
ncbi:sulfatase-like hydrolase/transferase [Engelhardtia mirabilis]|uniref:Arylsulfatase n=1 Tax=Engelhardtia mirabilis TaxID=2528011 RepID=A0A518BDH6_9BACT|nr:Arylsulfatase [Planctomycetes bacterium Pla133]QDU99367.1 Arylsulfatase [Planctomycetes bacterium Pla86]